MKLKHILISFIFLFTLNIVSDSRLSVSRSIASTPISKDLTEFAEKEGKIAFFPGSFDPPSRSHLSTVISLIEDYKFEKVYVVLNTKGPKNYMTSIDERMGMLRKGLVGYHDNIVFVNEPVDGKDPAYKGRLQDKLGKKVWGVTGGDGWELLPEVVKNDQNKLWIIMPRSELAEVEFPVRDNIVILSPKGMGEGTSSSYIRKSISKGMFPDGPLPKTVKDEIIKHHFYYSVDEAHALSMKDLFHKEWDHYQEKYEVFDIPKPEYKVHQSRKAWRDNFIRITVAGRKMDNESAEKFWERGQSFIRNGSQDIGSKSCVHLASQFF